MRIFLILCLFNLSFGYSQKDIPKNHFINPIDIPLVISGTFGELRSNHFHAGLDLKTQGKEGVNVFAAATGTIKRIKISNYGYGKAIYISHPNGYTTVYAHLKKFSPKIEEYVKKRQYALESYEIELFPKAKELNVQQGDIIAYSGNTGGSSGPHLHFEIRDSKSRPMNPLNFGIKVIDTIQPIINGVWLYSLSDSTHINGIQSLTKLRLIPVEKGKYRTEKVNAFGDIGIGVSTVDLLNLAPNKNGVYSIYSKINGLKNFELQMDRFSFSETRYVNRLIDYKYYKTNNSRICKLFIEKNNPLSVYKNDTNKGVITVKDSLSYITKIYIKDHNDNTTIIEIPIEGKRIKDISIPQTTTTTTTTTPNYVTYHENFTYKSGIFDVFIPKGSLYENAYLAIKVNGDTIELHKDEIPLHKKMTLVFDISNYNEEDKKKLYIGEINDKKKPFYCNTIKKGNRFLTKTKNFGTYSLFRDIENPIVTPINVDNKKWISNETHLKIKISDSDSGIESYYATLNGKFILMEYEHKTGILTYDFNDHISSETENNFKLLVLDNVGNSTTFEITFFKKP